MEIAKQTTRELTGKRLIGVSNESADCEIELVFEVDPDKLYGSIQLQDIYYFNNSLGVKEKGADIVESYTLDDLEESYFKAYPVLEEYRGSKLGFVRVYYADDQMEVLAGFGNASFDIRVSSDRLEKIRAVQQQNYLESIKNPSQN